MNKRQISRAAALLALSKNRGELEAKTLSRMLAIAGAPLRESVNPAQSGVGQPGAPLR
jgi:hypothetical protein